METPVKDVASVLSSDEPGSSPSGSSSGQCVHWKAFALFSAGLCLAFALPLWKLARYTLRSELNSHLLLIPFISAYLVWIRRQDLRWVRSTVSVACISALSFLGILLLLMPVFLHALHRKVAPADLLVLSTGSFVSFFLMGSCFFLGRDLTRQMAFPLCFLFFLVPVPLALEAGLSGFFQRASAELADLLFSVTGEPLIRTGMSFRLPGLTLTVAEECSGVRSSYVLFITSLIAGYMFLGSRWKRVLLAAFVIPLGIARNAFRIFVLAFGTIHVNPKVIDSPLHHQGGPVFFLLSLVPFFALLVWLRKTDRQGHKVASGRITEATAVRIS